MGYEFVDDEENKVAATGGYKFTDEPHEFTDEPEGRPQGESPIPLVSAGEAKAKGELGITETAQKDYEAATGVEAPKNPILAQIANMGLTVGGRLNANLQMQAAQKLAAGGNYTDRDMDDLMDQMIYGGVKKVNDAMETVPSVVGPGAEMAMLFHRKARQKQEPLPNEIMRDWDETEGKRYADPEERRIARMQYAGQIATDFIKERTAVKENATTELENREVTHTANIVSRGLGMLGYTAPYMLGPVGIGLQFLEEGSANAVGYANDEYGYDNDGRFRLVAEGDDAGRAAIAGFGTAGIETATEIVGGKIGGALAKRGGKALGKLVVGNKAAEAIGAGIGKIAGKTAETLGKTKVGRATLAFAKGVGSTFKWTSKKMHLENPIEENIEEFESQQANSLLGWDRRKSELENLTDEDGNPIDGVAARWWHDTKQFLKPSEIVKLNEAMLLTMGGGAAIAHFANRSARKDVDNIIRKHNLMSEEEIKTTSLEDKVKAFNAWADGLNEEQTARMIDEGTGVADRLAERIAGDYEANRKRVNALREKMAERDDYNNGLELDRLQIPRQKFNIPMREDERGRNVPDFKTVFTIDTETGEAAQRKAVYDESGISIVDNGGEGDAAYSVFSPDGKASRDFPTLTQAVKFATQIKNAYALDSARDGMKQQFIANEYEANYKGAKNQVIDVKSVDEAVKVGINMTGENVSTDANFRPSRKGWRLKDGTVILVRDNINSPAEVQRLMRHEIVGHSEGMMQNRWFEADEKSEIGKLRGANLEKTMKDGPVRESATRRALRETVANVVQQRRHSADTIDKVVHAVRNALRDRGINLKMNDTDLEVEVSRIENELRNGEGKTHTSIDGTIEKQEFREVEQPETETQTETPTETEEVNEAGNESHEEPAQPEQAAQGGQEAAEAGQAADVKPAEAEKPVSSRSVIEKMTDKTPVEEIPVSEVFNDDTRIPNFKEGANPETGEVEPLTGEPYDLVSNPIVVMEFKDGKKVVVTGRHRLALYKRSGREKIAACVIREADGWTVDDARMIDSIGNIIDEKGTVKDYVKYFEDAKPSRAAAESGGFLARPKGKLAFGIYEGASEDTRSAIDWEGGGADGLISPEQAGIIAEAAPKNAHPRFGAVQKILVAKAKNGLRGKKLGILARSLAEEVKKQKETVHTGDMMQLDLFTSPEDLAFLAMEEKRADYRTRKSQEYGRIAEVLRTAMSKGGKLDLNKEYARELGITDAKDKKQLSAARDKAVERADYWENAVQLDEADKAAMDAEIEDSVKKADAKRVEVAERLKAAKEEKPKPKTEAVGMHTAQTSEKAPTSVPKKAEAIAPTEVAKPAEGEKTPDSAKVEKKSASKSEKPPKKRTVTMKNAEEEKRVKALLDDITFDSPELDTKNLTKFSDWTAKFKLKPTDEKRQKEWADKNGVDFDSDEFDYEKFGKLVTGVGKLVDALAENGHNTFESLARYVSEVDAAKFERAKPVLQDVWNAVARQRKLARVSDDEAERVFGIIEAQTEKEASNENDGGGIRQVLRRIRGELPGEAPRAGGDSRVGVAGDESAAGEGSRSGGVLAGAVRGEDSGQGVDGERPGVLHGRPEGLADEGTAQGVRIRDAGREASDGDGSVGHPGVAEGGERSASGNRAGDGDNAGTDASAGRGRRVKRAAAKAAKETKVAPARPDFVMTKAVEDAILEPNKTKRVENNLAAIRLVLKGGLNERGATPEEQETLAKYVGWGGLSEIFDYNYESAWTYEKSGDSKRALDRAARAPMGKRGWELHKELRGLLNDEMFASARASSTTAFYTPIEMVRAEHAALRALGLKGGRFLGPSAGVGNYASAAGEYQNAVNWQFVEKDAISGLILKALFPNQRVNVMGFEETKFPDGFFDLAIDNVPYADVSITDKGLSASRFLVHDYFFAKTLSKLRPGGVMMFLTSTGTLDKGSGTLRKFLAEHGGRIVGAVRLPNGFFSQNANTEAAADLVVIQRVDGKADNSAFEGQHPFDYKEDERWDRKKGKWVTDKTPLSYNQYFADHPEQVIGKMEAVNGRFGKTLRYTMPGADDLWGKFGLVRQAIDRALAGVDKGAFLNATTVAEKPTHEPVYDDAGLRQGNISVKDGRVYIKSGDMLEPVEMPTDRKLKKELAKRLRTPKDVMDGVVKLRTALRAVVDAEMRGCTDEELKPLLAALNAEYDRFVAKNGSLHDKWVTPFVLLDKADGNRLLALERVGKDDTLSKADIFTKRVISIGAKAQKADTPKEALVVCYSENGTIVPDRVGELLGVSAEDAVRQLKESGDAFENPQTGRIEPSWEYLSGHVRSKLAAARAAVEAGDESFRANVAALEKVQPPDVKLEDVEVKFGAPWVDPEAMKDFLRDAFGSSQMSVTLKKSELTGAWDIELGARYGRRVVNNDSPWGNTTWDVTDFLQRVLNHASLESIHTDPVTKQKWRDEAETEANKLAAEKLHRSFGQFLCENEKWADASLRRYNDVNNDNVAIRLPENVMPFKAAGMSDGAMRMLFEDGDPAKPKKGREYQSQVIARGVLGGSSLCLAHCVGAGKTMEMQSIGMLGRHLGMFRKSMYVVPNHMLNQFCNEFIEAFPNANILRMTEEDVKPANRRAFFAQVANGDWDAIVVKHSTFSKKLGMSAAHQKQYAEERMKDLDLAIGELREQGDRISVKKAEKMKARLAENLKKLQDSEGKDAQIVPFEELGVDQLFVDEAHNFKGLEITTRQGKVGGLQQGDSQRATDMEMKCEYVQSLHGGDRGVVFATGTPLSNAPAVESYVMLRYLAPKALKEQGLWHFDDFIDSFGRITTETTFDMDGKSTKEKDIVSAFVNIPELMRLFKSRVDIVNADQLDIPRPKPKYHMIDVEMTPVQTAVMEAVSEQSKTPGGKEWPSKYMDMTWVAKYACISPRMLGFTDGGNKIPRVVSEVKKVYDETSGNRGAQLIFTDRFKNGYELAAGRVLGGRDIGARSGIAYNLNEEIKAMLVQQGIPESEIAIIQDLDKMKGDKDQHKEELFEKVRNGEVRVLIGSRAKMGEGTNVQKRLAAIHLLHPGWKPSEDEQAIGRIIRFGNEYPEGQIFYYLTKGNANIGSYETKNHELIGVKSRLIQQVMHSDDSLRTVEIDESAMDRDMLMGLASGNKALLELIGVRKNTRKLELNAESTATSARRMKDKSEMNTRAIAREREEWKETKAGIERWRKANDGKDFALTTTDGRSLEKAKDIADLVCAEVVKGLTMDNWERHSHGPFTLGDFNGVPLTLVWNDAEEKFYLNVRDLGVARKVNNVGFVPDFSPQAFDAFKAELLRSVDPDYAKNVEAGFADRERMAKKQEADAAHLDKEAEELRKELAASRKRQAQLEREVTPLLVKTTADHGAAAYGDWAIRRSPTGAVYIATKANGGAEVRAATVKALLPKLDEYDFGNPATAAKKTADLPRSVLGEDGTFETLKVENVDFMSTEFDGQKNGIIGNRERERRIVAALASGALRYPKFKPAEVAATQGEQHERLWNYITSLSVESTDLHPGRAGEGAEVPGRYDGSNRQGRGRFSGVGSRYEEPPFEKFGAGLKYLDAGQESRVYDAGNGEVIKVRKARFFDKNGLVDLLANVVYHNYLFPNDAYTLADIARYEHDGYQDFYLILRQPKVEPLKTADGFIVEPTIGQIMEALNASPMRFSFFYDGHSPVENEFDSSDSSDSDDGGEVVDVAKYKAYNGDFLVFDFQPGRNTFIDAKTGKVRFIDPRIMLNNPEENFSAASRFGKRKPYDKPLRINTDFMSDELSPEAASYSQSEDKTPTEEVSRKVFGMTNEDIATEMRAAGLEPPAGKRKSDDELRQQAEVLLSRPDYMAKLSRAVYKFGRPLRDYETIALGELFYVRQKKVNDLQDTLNDLEATPAEQMAVDPELAQMVKETRKKLKEARQLLYETGVAKRQGTSEQGRALRSNRMKLDRNDFSFAGISNTIAEASGGADKITPEMEAKIKSLADDFAQLDGEGQEILSARLKAFSEKVVNEIKNRERIYGAAESKPGNEGKRVMRNYFDAMAQIEVHANEVGDTLIGLVDQMYPSWGKWLKSIGEYHCYMNPEITEEAVVKAIADDVRKFVADVDENQIRDMLTGFGHSFRQSRYDSQRLMNDLRAQARMKRQLDWMNERNELPPATGMVRDELSLKARQLAREVQERKNEVDETLGGANRLKGALQSAKTRIKNRIEELEAAIESGERIVRVVRPAAEDAELRELKSRRDSLQAVYDNIFGTKRGKTEEQRVKAVEQALSRELEKTIEDLARARSGDFSKRAKPERVTSATADALRQKIAETKDLILELKRAAYEFGLTPEEIAKRNAQKMNAREAAIMRIAERIERGDLRTNKKPQPPMPPEMQKRYDEMGRQLKKAHQRLADMRLEAENATTPTFWRKTKEYASFVTAAQRALRATLDFSATLRQAARLTLRHPLKAASSFAKSWTAMKSEANLQEVNGEIMSDPNVQEAVSKYGLHLREVDAESARDVEMFHGMERNRVRLFGKDVAITDIPFFGELMLKSERHYLTYLNAMSAELYCSIANDRTRFPGGATPWQKKMVCDMINIWNGSGAISKERRQALQKAWVNEVFWAPGLAISRVQSAVGYVIWSPLVAKGVKNADGGYDAVSAEERKTMAKIGASEHLKSSLAMLAIGALLKFIFGSDDDWYKFNQSDWFEKLLLLASPNVGNTTIDLTGGEASVYRLAHTIATGKKKSISGRTMVLGETFGAPSHMQILQRFLEGKFSPWLSETVAIISGRDYTGEKYTLGKALVDSTIPLTLTDVYEQVEQNGIGKSLVTIPLALLGAGGSTYDRKPYENAVNPFLEAVKEYNVIENDDLLDEQERERLLDNIRASNPLMRDEVRDDIAADIKWIRKDEARVKKDEKNGFEPDADLLSEIEQNKAKLLEKIRTARRK